MTNIFLPRKSNLLLAALAIAFAVGISFGQEPWSSNTSPLPASTGYVNDYAGVIDAATKQQLETKLKNLKETTNPPVEIAVAVVKTTGERPIFDYSLATARGWKIGSKDDDNPSALLMVAIDDRKYFTQVSKDLEDELPDGVVGSLQRQYLVPEFKKGNYAKGISDTIDAYISTIQGKSTNTGAAAPQKPMPEKEGGIGGTIFSLFCCGGVILVILLIIFSRSKGGPTKGGRGGWGGGGFGGGGGDIVAGALPWVIGSILSGAGSSSGSSSSGDSGGSSGGSDWGGFGGGGDFGGGGAGGDW